jgi:hypothetical protein
MIGGMHAHNCELLRRRCRWRRGDEFDVENWKRMQALTSDSVEENLMRRVRAMYHHHWNDSSVLPAFPRVQLNAAVAQTQHQIRFPSSSHPLRSSYAPSRYSNMLPFNEMIQTLSRL